MKVLFSNIFILIHITLFAQAPQVLSPIVWENVYNDRNVSIIHNIYTCKDGSYVFAGYSYAKGTKDLYKGWYAKIDSSGQKIWEGYFGAKDAAGINIIELSNGEYFLTGSIDSHRKNNPYAFYAWIDKNGKIIKDGVCGDGTHCLFNKAIECRDKSIVVAGDFSSPYLFRFSPDRKVIDSINYELDENMTIYLETLVEKPDGKLMFMGMQYNEDESYTEMFFNVDAELNAKPVPGIKRSAIDMEVPETHYMTAKNEHIVAGSRRYANDEVTYWYAKIDKDRKIIWEKEINNRSGVGQCMVAYDNNLHVCALGDAEKQDIRFFIFNEQGETVYEYVHKTQRGEFISDMTVGDDGRIIITGDAHLESFIYCFKPQLKHSLNVYVYDIIDKKPVPATVKVKFQDGSIKEYNTDSTGVSIPVAKGDSCIIQIEAFGYQPQSDIIISASGKLKPEYSFYLAPLEAGATFVMKHVQFERGTTTLYPDSYTELDKLVQFMKDHPKVKIELSGHTDNGGLPKTNQTLSEQRVITVKGYLVSKGIAANRITGKGYGGKKPVAPNDTEENMSKNRRVEVKIL